MVTQSFLNLETEHECTHVERQGTGQLGKAVFITPPP